MANEVSPKSGLKNNQPKVKVKNEEEKKERMAQQNYLNRVGIKNSG